MGIVDIWKHGLRFLMSNSVWVKYYDVDLINTIVAKVETKIESITLYSNDIFVIWISGYYTR
jgi:hypothetical protein